MLDKHLENGWVHIVRRRVEDLKIQACTVCQFQAFFCRILFGTHSWPVVVSINLYATRILSLCVLLVKWQKEFYIFLLYMSTHAHLSICLFVYLAICLFVYLPTCLLVYVFIFVLVYFSTCRNVDSSNCQLVY